MIGFRRRANKPDAPNAAFALWFHSGHHWLGVGDLRRSAQFTLMKTSAVILTLAATGFAVCVAGPPPFKPATPSEFRQPEPPIGRLGYRIGTYLTIEGAPDESGKGGNATLIVDKIGDYRLTDPVAIRVDHFSLPRSGRCVLKGFETGSWAGIPFSAQIATNAESATPIPISEIEVEQGPWQFVYSFRVLSVVQPKQWKEKP